MKVTEKQLTEFRQKIELYYRCAVQTFKDNLDDPHPKYVAYGELYAYRRVLHGLYKTFYGEELPDEFKRF